MSVKSSVPVKAAYPMVAAASALAAALLCAGTAFAQPDDSDENPMPSNAAEAIAKLQSEGHSVVVRGNDGGTLDACDVASVTKAGDESNTMIVEVSCVPDYEG